MFPSDLLKQKYVFWVCVHKLFFLTLLGLMDGPLLFHRRPWGAKIEGAG